MIKVSVIVAVYNAEKYLAKCIESLLGQTLNEIEIITVDDGSVDASVKILAGYAEKSDRIIFLSKPNGGAADARNFGLEHATGEYVGYIDSDDYADADMYEIMYKKAAERGSDIVECNLHHTYDGGEDTEVMVKYYTPGELLCFGRFVVWNKIFKREWLLGTGVAFPVNLIYEDAAFAIKTIPFINNYDYVDAAPVHYVQRNDSVNNSTDEKTMDIFDVLRDVTAFFREKGFYGQYEKEIEFLYARILLCSSFKRMCRMGDNKLRARALRMNYLELAGTFPEWRKNPILKKEKNRNAIFMKVQLPFIYKINCTIFPMFINMKTYVNRIGRNA